MQQTDVRSGYLVLADISGYTAFLAGTELEHAHGILSELTAHIRGALAPPLRFVKLEGDCVFCYAPEDAFGSAERVVELVEVCYLEFSDRLLDMQRATTCTCAACASIHTLDLKFIAHFGSFAVSREGSTEDLTGKDVILAHRLLKNTVTEETGVQAYALFTDAFLQQLPDPLDLPAYACSYDGLGDVHCAVEDLKPVMESMREARVAYISDEEADFRFTADVAAPPALVWDAWMDPRKIVSWQHDLTGMEVRPNERGRTGVGATSHCAHGSAMSAHRYLDFRPFRYWTETSEPVKGLMGPPAATYTVELTPTDDGTHVVFRMRARTRGLPGAVMRAAFGSVVRRSLSRYARQLKEMGETHARHVAGD
jgi:uncharacterized protein YndB with AHSA1/START domain